jgi:hypothetical protein
VTVAALYVQRGGCYYGLPGVDPWDEARDARTYAGPHPVVAHPPCQRWGRYWFGGPSATVRRKLGDDGGCFAAALAAVRRWGGVLEHPEASRAWRTFGLHEPPRSGGWVVADFEGGWTCCVAQGHYGHRAQKLTWLFAVRCALPSLTWGLSVSAARLDQGFHSAEERARFRRGMSRKAGVTPEDRAWARDRFEAITGRKRFERLTANERAATPIPFRDLLLEMARSAAPGNRAAPARLEVHNAGGSTA